jgi:predicted nucleotidyltransferase
MVEQVARGTAKFSSDIDLEVFRMFGSMSKEIAAGVAIGITFALQNLQEDR